MRGLGQAGPSILVPGSTPGPWASGYVLPSDTPAPTAKHTKTIAFKKPASAAAAPPPAESSWPLAWQDIPLPVRVCLGVGALAGLYYLLRGGRRLGSRPFGGT